jgi:tricorn protease
VPVEGGEPKRLTWHPGEDIVRGFTPDGKVLFTSQRAVFSRRHSQFFTIGVDGGVPQALPVPTGDMGAISPDGTYLAYTALGERFRQWKSYRGGTASRIWVLRLTDLSHEEIPKPSDGCNDTQPMRTKAYRIPAIVPASHRSWCIAPKRTDEMSTEGQVNRVVGTFSKSAAISRRTR